MSPSGFPFSDKAEGLSKWENYLQKWHPDKTISSLTKRALIINHSTTVQYCVTKPFLSIPAQYSHHAFMPQWKSNFIFSCYVVTKKSLDLTVSPDKPILCASAPLLSPPLQSATGQRGGKKECLWRAQLSYQTSPVTAAVLHPRFPAPVPWYRLQNEGMHRTRQCYQCAHKAW